MLVLKVNQVCPIMSCQYANDCQGTNSNRDTEFTCSFVNEHGIVSNGNFRNNLDVTGKMTILTESVQGCNSGC